MTKRDQELVTGFVAEVGKVTSILLRETVSLRLSEGEGFRLYRLQIWCWRYKVPLVVVLRELLKHWHGKLSFKRLRGQLGIRIATLTGPKSKEFLLTRLAELYPHHENEKDWQLAQQALVVPLTSASTNVTSNPFQYMAHYKTEVRKTRHKLVIASKKYGRRKYRNSCWV